jgi:hypothetical protein
VNTPDGIDESPVFKGERAIEGTAPPASSKTVERNINFPALTLVEES